MEVVEWKFGVVGNIISEHTDENGNVYYGSKAFTPGEHRKRYRCRKPRN